MHLTFIWIENKNLNYLIICILKIINIMQSQIQLFSGPATVVFSIYCIETMQGTLFHFLHKKFTLSWKVYFRNRRQ